MVGTLGVYWRVSSALPHDASSWTFLRQEGGIRCMQACFFRKFLGRFCVNRKGGEWRERLFIYCEGDRRDLVVILMLNITVTSHHYLNTSVTLGHLTIQLHTLTNRLEVQYFAVWTFRTAALTNIFSCCAIFLGRRAPVYSWFLGISTPVIAEKRGEVAETWEGLYTTKVHVIDRNVYKPIWKSQQMDTTRVLLGWNILSTTFLLSTIQDLQQRLLTSPGRISYSGSRDA